jgi:DNA polymerase
MIIKCNKCDLCLTRKNIVNGHGNIGAELMFIGEAPGYTEDKYGTPFTGKAGALLTKYLELFNFHRITNIYITNIIKCRPPSNRKPTNIEISNCRPYLINEINTVNPKIIVLLGNTAIETLLGVTGISKIRGKWIHTNSRWIMPMFHPSYLLDDSRLKERTLMFNDFNKILDKYREIVDWKHNTNF